MSDDARRTEPESLPDLDQTVKRRRFKKRNVKKLKTAGFKTPRAWQVLRFHVVRALLEPPPLDTSDSKRNSNVTKSAAAATAAVTLESAPKKKRCDYCTFLA